MHILQECHNRKSQYDSLSRRRAARCLLEHFDCGGTLFIGITSKAL